MYLPGFDPMGIYFLGAAGFIGWLAKGAKALFGGRKERKEKGDTRVSDALSRASRIGHEQGRYAQHSRQAAASAGRRSDPTPQRRVQRQIARNQESRRDYSRRTRR